MSDGVAPAKPRDDKTTTLTGLRPSLPAFVMNGRYRLLRPLGEGGQKIVFLARDTRLPREVVVCFLRTQGLEEIARKRLIREALTISRLGDHPHIVSVYDVGEELGLSFFVMQYVDGGSLKDLLERTPGKPLPILHVIDIARQVAMALDHAHTRNVIHRDLKPSNIWFMQTGIAKLGDFGLAQDLTASRLSASGHIVGTAAYISPEQAQGFPVVTASDLYSLGVTLYEAATGRMPFVADSLMGLLWQHMNAEPVAPSWHNPEIPAGLDALILQLLQKLPEQRPVSAAAVIKALDDLSLTPAFHEDRDRTSLARVASGVFVGREPEIDLLKKTLHKALGSQGRIAIVIGEPGSGKTTLAQQITAYARLFRAQVLVGNCLEGEGSPAFWPWVQILRGWLKETPRDLVQGMLGSGGGEIADLLPQIREILPSLPQPAPLEPERARFRLFDCVATLLKNASARAPIVVLLDDLQWADRPSLKLLEFLAQEIGDARLLVLATCRDSALEPSHPVTTALAGLARQGVAERVTLAGIGEEEIARLIERMAGVAPSVPLVSAVMRKTEGNPFFVNEIVRLLVSEGKLSSGADNVEVNIPQELRDVVSRRLSGLSEDCFRALGAAAVIGRAFALDVLAEVQGGHADTLLDVVEEAVEARVLREVTGGVDTFTFVHDIFRSYLYDRHSESRRRRVHRQIAQAFEKLYAARLEPHCAELAYHHCQSLPFGDADKAMEYSDKAALAATQLHAYEEAAEHYHRALKVLESSFPQDDDRRFQLLLALGEAQKRSGAMAESKETLLRAVTTARALNQPERMARAALAMEPPVSVSTGTEDLVQIRALEESLAALPEQDSGLRARLLAHLSLALYYQTDLRMQLSLAALDMARRVGDPVALFTSLYSRHQALNPAEDLPGRFEISTEMLRLAELVRNPELILRARYRRCIDWMELGRIEEFEKEALAAAKLGEELRQPAYQWLPKILMAGLAGLRARLEDAERLVREAAVLGQRAQDPLSQLFVTSLMSFIRNEQGRAEEHIPVIQGALKRFPLVRGFHATNAYLCAQIGKVEEARQAMERLAEKDFADLPRDGAYIVTLAMLSHVVRTLKDARRAAIIHDLLKPFAGRNIVSFNTAMGCGYISRYLALTAWTAGRYDEAEAYYEETLRENLRIGAVGIHASAEEEYAEMLIERGRPCDSERAISLLRDSLKVARQVGMRGLERKASGSLESGMLGFLARRAQVE